MNLPKTLKLRDLTYSFPDGGMLFKEISFDLTAGETVVLFGGNGTGKSTLLKCIAGIESFSSGEISVSGYDGSAYTKSIGLVMQNPEHQMIAPTVEEEIALGLEFRGVEPREIEERVERELERHSLRELRTSAPDSLSGGQMQRVALAAITVLQPTFLLFDEPDSLLDAPSRRDFLNAVVGIRQEHGILWACADADRLPDADRYYWLNNFRVQEVSVDQLQQAS